MRALFISNSSLRGNRRSECVCGLEWQIIGANGTVPLPSDNLRVPTQITKHWGLGLRTCDNKHCTRSTLDLVNWKIEFLQKIISFIFVQNPSVCWALEISTTFQLIFKNFYLDQSNQNKSLLWLWYAHIVNYTGIW